MKPYNKILNHLSHKPNCEGLFFDLKALPSNLGPDPFGSPPWLSFIKKKIFLQKRLFEEKNYTPEAPYAVYQTVVTKLLKEKLHIIDIGGGIGHSYFQLISGLPEGKFRQIFYTVIDSRENCIAGRQFFSNSFPNIEFIENLDDLQFKTKQNRLVYISSTMQYIPAWKDF